MRIYYNTYIYNILHIHPHETVLFIIKRNVYCYIQSKLYLNLEFVHRNIYIFILPFIENGVGTIVLMKLEGSQGK